ncbi:MAG TPA: PEP/pyruvate-binding domain-containing protein [Oscillatoriaceae cyanobacterium]
MIHWLNTLTRNDAPHVGAKAAHLGELARHGFEVPDGFAIGLDAYQAFLRSVPGLNETIAALESAHPAEAARTLATAFRGSLPVALEQAVREAYQELGRRLGQTDPAVAVRSSAVGEDSAGASYAGQQLTVLNARGESQVIACVRACWGGLWSERAITYRRRVGVPAHAVTAVLVQALVVPKVAGVAFTANPVTGDRDEFLVDASYGLGEAVVSGRVMPDHVVVRKQSGQIAAYLVGAKATEVLPEARGVVEKPVSKKRQRKHALTTAELRQLVDIGLELETHFGAPQDIEWAIAQGKLYLLQARPITALPPAPPSGAWTSPIPGARWERRNFAEQFPGPLSPLGASLVLGAVGEVLPRLAREAGLKVGTPALTTINGYAYARGGIKPRWTFPFRTLGMGAAVLFGQPKKWERKPGHDQRLAPYLDRPPQSDDAKQLVAWCEGVVGETAKTWMNVHRLSAGWRWSEYVLRRALEGLPVTPGMLLQGFGSPVMAMEQRLHEIAREADEPVRAALAQSDPWQALWALGDRAEAFRAYIQRFCAGAEGLPATFDPAMPLPYQDPAQVCRMLAGAYASPRERLEALVMERELAHKRALVMAKGLRRAVLKRVIPWAQGYAQVREPALATLGRGWQSLRERLLELGALYTREGLLPEPVAIFLLDWKEVRAMSRGEAGPSAEHLADRRALWSQQSRYTPPFSIGGKPERVSGRALTGVPASPGRVTGIARVVNGPEDFASLSPGEILVAPATTPAWTPLFHLAAAIVTDVGGPLSHGSIVAREFRIPAVLGTEAASRRIRSGEMVTVDGDLGLVWAERG